MKNEQLHHFIKVVKMAGKPFAIKAEVKLSINGWFASLDFQDKNSWRLSTFRTFCYDEIESKMNEFGYAKYFKT